jgi:hypothetical protein
VRRQELVPARSSAQPPEGGCLGGVARRDGGVKHDQFPSRKSCRTHTHLPHLTPSFAPCCGSKTPLAISSLEADFSCLLQTHRASDGTEDARAPRRRLGARGLWRPPHRRRIHGVFRNYCISWTSSPFRTGGAAAGAARRRVVVDRIGCRRRKCRKTVAAAASTESDSDRGARTGAVRVGIDMVVLVRLVAHVGHGRCKTSGEPALSASRTVTLQESDVREVSCSSYAQQPRRADPLALRCRASSLYATFAHRVPPCRQITCLG